MIPASPVSGIITFIDPNGSASFPATNRPTPDAAFATETR